MAEETNGTSSSAMPPSSGVHTEASHDQHGDKAVDVSEEKQTSGSIEEGALGSDGISEAPKTNGNPEHAEQDPNDSSNKATEPPHNTRGPKDTEMKDTQDVSEDAGAAASPAAPATNGTPAHSKRASMGGSSKKRAAAVPEHKSKKLNKKKSKPLTNLAAQPGEYYIARMKGHPPWPSIICDEDMLPQSLLTSRPVTAQLADGTFKKPEYADGGKRAYERTFPIMFLHTNEFAWIPNTELMPLDVEADSTKNPIEKGKKQALIQAYRKAAENHDLDHFKAMLADHQMALEADLQEKEEAEKERSAKKAKKASRKSDAAVADDGDEMDIDEDAAAEKPRSKKRKKADDSDEANEKPAKTPKTATKLKLSTPKTPAAEASVKKKAAKPKSGKAQKSASEDDVVTPKVEEKPLTPKEMREMKEKKVLYYRHKLQRGFLARDTTPKEDEMKAMSDFLGELEGYPDLEGSIIRTTKIHKVLKAMIKLGSIPLDEEFHFKTRSSELLGKWNEILSNDTSAGAIGDKDTEAKGDDAAALMTNGEAKTIEEQAEKAEAGEAAAPEEESEAQVEKKIGTPVEGDKDADDVPGTLPESTFTERQRAANEEENGDTEMAET